VKRLLIAVKSKRQATFPAKARRGVEIHAGTKDDRLEVIHAGGSVRDLKGSLPKPQRALSLAEMDGAIAPGRSR